MRQLNLLCLTGVVLFSTALVTATGCDGNDPSSPPATPTATSTVPPEPSATPEATPSATAPLTATPTLPATHMPTPSPEPTATATHSPEPSATATPVVPTATATATATAAATPTGPITENLALEGLPDDVEVLFDDHGIPHVYAPNLAAAAFTEGYLTASSRFWQMDLFRRFGQGRLSEILGPLALEIDIRNRTLFTTRDGRRVEEVLWEHALAVDPEAAALGQAYADGVNAWLADLRGGRNGATLPPEYANGILISETPMSLVDWRPQDSLAIGRVQAQGQSDTLGFEIDFARRVALLPDDVLRDTRRAAPPVRLSTVPPAEAAKGRRRAPSPDVPVLSPEALPDAELLGRIDALLKDATVPHPFADMVHGAGSNAWVVGPEKSASGHAMLASDPHLPLFNPPIWYVLHMDVAADADGVPYRANGVIFPGLPGIILGHNDVVAWGSTNGGIDVTDIYMEEITTPPDYPASPRTVTFRGEQVPVLRLEEVFRVRGRANPIVRVIEVVPHHGPMVPDPDTGDAVVGLAATGMSFRWTGHEVSNEARFLFDLGKMRSVDDFESALENFGVGAQNWFFADVEGNIAYSSRVKVPQRPAGVIPYLPMSGQGDAEWLTDENGDLAWVPYEKLPAVTNPAQGYLASANNDPIGNSFDNDPLNDDVYLFFSRADGFRQQRIVDLLSNDAGVRGDGEPIGIDDMARYQFDNQNPQAPRLLPFLFAAAERRADLVDAQMSVALDRLREWAVDKPDSVAYAMVSGVDAHDLRADVKPRPAPVSEEERIDAVAASLYAALTRSLPRRVFDDDFAGSGVGGGGMKEVLHLLEDVDSENPALRVHTLGPNGESRLWDDIRTTPVETSDEILLRALRDGLTYLEGRFSTADMSQWLWGLVHQVRFSHFLDQGGITAFNLGPFAASGGNTSINASFFDGDFRSNFGPSKRFVVLLDPAGVRGSSVLPGGNNGNPGRPPGGPSAAFYNTINPSTHYGDHTADWLNGERFDYRYTRHDVEAHLERRWSLTPR